MTTSLNPKLLDVVTLPSGNAGSELEALTGTVVEVYGSGEIIVEISDREGVGKDLITISSHDAPVVWRSKVDEPIKSEKDAARLFEEGMLLLQNGLLAKARNKFAKSFELDRDQARVLLNSTLELVKQENFDSAIAVLRLIAELQPRYELARENLARTHLNRGVRDARRGSMDKAFEDFTNALLIGTSPELINLARRNLAAVHTQVAIKHEEIQRFDEAIQLFLIAYQLEPSQDTRKNFALALVSKSARKDEGRPHVSEENFRQPILMGLTFSECLNAYGATLARIGDVSRGKDFLRKAIEIDPTNERARRNLELLSAGNQSGIQELAIWALVEPQPVTLPVIQ